MYDIKRVVCFLCSNNSEGTSKITGCYEITDCSMLGVTNKKYTTLLMLLYMYLQIISFLYYFSLNC